MNAPPPHWQKDLDASGLLCPLPALKAKRALNQMGPGEVLRVRATDPRAAQDFAVLCQQSGHVLEAVIADGEGCWLFVRRS